ncbi:hypothetical protein Hfx1149_17145 [Haloferax sp. CBA1149]|uniref:Uncharacterized protein n=1 Tax=Haloferax sp. CBA1149 TaxID=2650753 RepID=A0A643JS25_9EURY|nr:hypothetical protein Hfx1149_17145 [Haloferax sp. CBA1149]
MKSSSTPEVHNQLRIHLAQALTRSDSPVVTDHINAALTLCDELFNEGLHECQVCGRIGLTERIAVHTCKEQSQDL